jgi:hypothetical protein
MSDNFHSGDFEVVGARRFHMLQPGDKFSALIHDIRPGEVTIDLGGGSLYTARSLVLPEARIGEHSVFAVRENDFEGRIVLEMVKFSHATKKVKMITEALKNAEFAVTPENIEVGIALLDNGLPVDAQTLEKTLSLNPEEAVAKLKNEGGAPVPQTQRFTFDMRV